MIEKVRSFVEEQDMLKEHDYVVAGVSGGADSVCLLYMLLELQKKIDFQIHVVHINHMIREEAGEDAAYVEALCKEHKLPFSLICRDVEKEAAERQLSTEEMGRLNIKNVPVLSINGEHFSFKDALKKIKNGEIK